MRPRREVEVFVSRGVASVVVPELIGLTLSEARSTLSHRVDPLGEGGLRVGYLAYAHSTEVKEGHVLAQSPLAKTSVHRGTPVSLLISQGSWPKSFQMPNLVGMRVEDALQRVEGYGLVIKEVKETYKTGELEDVVIDQRPSQGYQVMKGDPVNLVISRWGGWDREKPKFQIIRFTVPPGFLPKEVRVVITDDQGEQEVYNKQEPPGHILEIPVKTEGTARILIYVDGELVEEGAL